jgi:hypothetical protein
MAGNPGHPRSADRSEARDAAFKGTVVDGAIIHKFQGKSYRAHRAVPAKQSGKASTAQPRST